MIDFLVLVVLLPLSYTLHLRWQQAPSLSLCASAYLLTFVALALLARARVNRPFRAGLVLLVAGNALNAAATLLNGGRMPFVGPFESHGGWVAADATTRVPWLIDRINGASVGDLLLVAGALPFGAGLTAWFRIWIDPAAAGHQQRLFLISAAQAAALSVVCSGVPLAVGEALWSGLSAGMQSVRTDAALTVRALTLPPTRSDTLAAIRAASAAYRLDAGCMLHLANTLSTTGRDPRAYAPGAAAVGLYRFTPATWRWASAGQYGHTLPLEAREDDRISAWVAAYVMDLSGAQHWRAAGARDCRLYGEHGPPPWDGYRAGAQPYDHSVSHYWLPWWCDWCAQSVIDECARERTDRLFAALYRSVSWYRCGELWSDLGPGVVPSTTAG